MIFFVGNDGTIINSTPSPVYQGSANANDIVLVAPFAANLSVTAAFKLPNGVILPPRAMTPQGIIEGVVNETTKENYAMWKYSEPNRITQYYGTVTAQFTFYTATGAMLASSATSFVVGKGVPPILPPTPTDTVYQDILANLSKLQQDIANILNADQFVLKTNTGDNDTATGFIGYNLQGDPQLAAIQEDGIHSLLTVVEAAGIRLSSEDASEDGKSNVVMVTPNGTAATQPITAPSVVSPYNPNTSITYNEDGSILIKTSGGSPGEEIGTNFKIGTDGSITVMSGKNGGSNLEFAKIAFTQGQSAHCLIECGNADADVTSIDIQGSSVEVSSHWNDYGTTKAELNGDIGFSVSSYDDNNVLKTTFKVNNDGAYVNSQKIGAAALSGIYSVNYNDVIDSNDPTRSDAATNADFLPPLPSDNDYHEIYAITNYGQLVKCSQQSEEGEGTEPVYTGQWNLEFIRNMGMVGAIKSPNAEIENLVVTNDYEFNTSGRFNGDINVLAGNELVVYSKARFEGVTDFANNVHVNPAAVLYVQTIKGETREGADKQVHIESPSNFRERATFGKRVYFGEESSSGERSEFNIDPTNRSINGLAKIAQCTGLLDGTVPLEQQRNDVLRIENSIVMKGSSGNTPVGNQSAIYFNTADNYIYKDGSRLWMSSLGPLDTERITSTTRHLVITNLTSIIKGQTSIDINKSGGSNVRVTTGEFTINGRVI